MSDDRSTQTRKRVPSRDVDSYIAAAPEQARAMLEQLRTIVKAVAPNAEERISYGMPYYKDHGRPLVGFAAFKNHCGLYGSTAALLPAYREELRPYHTSPGTIRFPIGEPLPVTLIKKLVKARVRASETR